MCILARPRPETEPEGDLTSLTIITICVVAFGIIGPKGYGRALALGGATPAGAALVFGATVVPTFYAVAVGTTIALAVRLIRDERRDPLGPSSTTPGLRPLVLLAVWSTLVTLLAPELFTGLSVLLPSGVEGHLSSGVFTNSNYAQIVYLILGVLVVAYLARASGTGPELVGLAAGATTLLSFWRYLGQTFKIPFPNGVFDNSPSFAYIETFAGGEMRFRGILSEPSGLAVSCLVTMAYMLSRATHTGGWRRWGSVTIAAIAAYMAAISTSGTFVVAGVTLVGIAGFTFAAQLVLRRARVRPIVVAVASIAAIVALAVLPTVAAFVQNAINAKLGSSSFDDRSSADSQSYGLFFDTFGTGVGLGSNRPSSFVAALLGGIGLPGVVLFVTAIAIVFVRTSPIKSHRPVIWALVALLVSKVIASPDLSDSSGILWISIGVLARAAIPQARTSLLDQPFDARGYSARGPRPTRVTRAAG